MYDPVIFDVLKVNSVDFAKQITLIDVQLLQAISTEELASFGWNGKNKRVDSPNMMHLTDRFNMICFWCQREILLRCSYMKRARCIEHFIVIAKHLMSLNNLHSTFAILSALKSEPIYRLAKTWNNVARHSLAVLDKLSALFNSERNWNQLREYMSTTCLPCIPYLGLYLTDMCFILQGSKANKLTKASADQKLDEILRAISWMQNSRYDFVHVPCLQQYLLAFKFHHEFTDFMEEAMYRESLLCEPNGCSDVQGTVCNDSVDTSSLARKFATISCSISSNMCGKGTQSHLKTVPLKQHKISRNIPVHMLGKQTIISSLLRSRTNRTVKSNSKFYCSLDSEFIDPAKDDDSDSYMSRKISYPYLIRKLDKLHSRNYSNLRKAAEVFDHVQLQDSGYIFCDYEGEVKRITVRDHGNKRVKVHHIQKYYLELQANRLLQFQRKLVHFQSGNMRNFYNEKANEQMVLGKNHWMVKNCEKVDGCTFELHHPPTDVSSQSLSDLFGHHFNPLVLLLYIQGAYCDLAKFEICNEAVTPSPIYLLAQSRIVYIVIFIEALINLIMVIKYTSSVVEPAAYLYMGVDKYENEHLIRWGWLEDVWFHVDKLSSAHVYLRMPKDMTIDTIPPALLTDCAQLVKANSIQGCKMPTVDVVYTPWENLLKAVDMVDGQVGFKDEKQVYKIRGVKKIPATVNRLNKTEKREEIDYRQEREERDRQERTILKEEERRKKLDELAVKDEREKEKQLRSYEGVFTEEKMAATMDDGNDSDDFM